MISHDGGVPRLNASNYLKVYGCRLAVTESDCECGKLRKRWRSARAFGLLQRLVNDRLRVPGKLGEVFGVTAF